MHPAPVRQQLVLTFSPTRRQCAGRSTLIVNGGEHEPVCNPEEAIEAAREEFIDTAEGGGDDEPPVPQQFNLQKYVMQDGDTMWQAEFFEDEGEAVECLPLRSGAAAQAIFDGDYDEVEITAEWIDENTLYEWEEGDFQLEPPLDTEEGRAAADEWDER